MTAPPARASRVVSLDVLRAVAILLVIGHHVVLDSHHVGRLRPLVGFLQRIGWTGVDLFFVLSGFLVGGLLFDELRTTGTVDSRRFLVRRAFKIWPTYYLFLLLELVRAPSGARALVPSFLHLQNYLGTPQIHTWSLAVEEHFYLALALLVPLLARTRARSLPVLVAVVAIACTLLRWVANHDASYDNWHQVFPTHLRVDSLFFGVLLANAWRERAGFRAFVVANRALWLVGGLATVSPMALLPLDTSPFVRIWGFALLYLGFGAIVLAVQPVGEPRPPSTITRALAFVGFHSYPIYLLHLAAGKAPAQHLAATAMIARLPPELAWLIVTSIYVALSVIAGVAMGLLIERPALALRERFFPRSASSMRAS